MCLAESLKGPSKGLGEGVGRWSRSGHQRRGEVVWVHSWELPEDICTHVPYRTLLRHVPPRTRQDSQSVSVPDTSQVGLDLRNNG